VGRGVLCLDDDSAAYAGRSPSRPAPEALLKALRDPHEDPGEDAAALAQLRRVRDERSLRRVLAPGPAPLTWGLIGLNVAVYLLQLHVKGIFEGQGLESGQAANAAMLSLGANLHWGSRPGFQAWRLLAAAFLHGNEIHLAMNMTALYSLGRLTERLAGWWRTALFYLAAAVISSFVSELFLPMGTPSVGASGAILGLAGLLMAPRWRPAPGFPRVLALSLYQWLAKPMLFLFVLGFGLQLLDLPIQFDNMAHLGGLCFGFGLGYLFPSFLVRVQSAEASHLPR
jgi:rhomboid protease GluP